MLSKLTPDSPIILFNYSNEDFQVNEGDRIAQLIFERFSNLESLDLVYRIVIKNRDKKESFSPLFIPKKDSIDSIGFNIFW